MVTVSYGDICNMELLLKWGFSIPGNPITTCKQDRSASSRSISRVISKIKTTQGQFRIIGHWDSAIATYDAMSRRMYLEFEVLQEPPESHIDGMTALVELDGVTVAKTEDPKAEVLIENVGLGRHWLSIRVVGAGRGDVAHETVEILLPYHYEVLITEPQDLMLVSRKEDLRVCAAISPPANCSRNQCTPSQSSAVLNLIVDGVTAGIVSDVKGTQHVTSKCRSFSFGAMWHEGWHSLAVELVSKDGIPSGPISYMHRVVLVVRNRILICTSTQMPLPRSAISAISDVKVEATPHLSACAG